jgi:hypothetical protein
MLPSMRIRIDNDLLQKLRAMVGRKRVSLMRLVGRMLRARLRAERGGGLRTTRYREKTYAMGVPRVDLRKALAVAAALEDERYRDIASRP